MTTHPLPTLRSDGGSFGAHLAGLGFPEGQTKEHWMEGRYYVTERHVGGIATVRVVCYPEDDGRARVLVFEGPARLERFRIDFAGTTPYMLAVDALASIIRDLEVEAAR